MIAHSFKQNLTHIRKRSKQTWSNESKRKCEPILKYMNHANKLLQCNEESKAVYYIDSPKTKMLNSKTTSFEITKQYPIKMIKNIPKRVNIEDAINYILCDFNFRLQLRNLTPVMSK